MRISKLAVRRAVALSLLVLLFILFKTFFSSSPPPEITPTPPPVPRSSDPPVTPAVEDIIVTPAPSPTRASAPWMPHVYCISLPHSISRRTRMKQRFDIYGFNYTFVDAIYADSALVDYYAGEHKDVDWQHRKDIGCYAGHLRAIRTGLENLRSSKEELTPRGFFVAEDDVLFHNDFVAKWLDAYGNLPDGATLLSLTYMYSDNPKHENVGKDLAKDNIRSIDPVVTWGAQMYWISEHYAQEALLMLDRPMAEIVTSEIIIRKSRGCIVLWPIVIEDGIDSDRAPQDIPFHAHHFGYWGWHNFNKGDPDGLSPLRTHKPG